MDSVETMQVTLPGAPQHQPDPLTVWWQQWATDLLPVYFLIAGPEVDGNKESFVWWNSLYLAFSLKYSLQNNKTLEK